MIYTFYSYKGGVGRSMALANIAELLYESGLRVIMVDWDLEAPGLESFFEDELRKSILDSNGVMELIQNYKERLSRGVKLPEQNIKPGDFPEDLPFTKPEDYLLTIHTPNAVGGSLKLLTAGKRAGQNLDHYTENILNFDWKDFYMNWAGEVYVEWLRKQLEQCADIILIDSRTGLSEIGGVCTYQLADTVVFFCTTNKQNIEGTYEVAKRLKSPDVVTMRGGRPINIMILPSRMEKDEPELLDLFHKEFVAKFTELVPSQNRISIDEMWELGIPYVPRYAFHEELVVKNKSLAVSQALTKIYHKISQFMRRYELVNLIPNDIPSQKTIIQEPLLVVISGPSGAGKDSVLSELKNRNLPYYFVVTATTRARRGNEIDGEDYFFVSHNEFYEMIEKDELIEYAIVYNDYKGIPKSQIRQALTSGRDVIMRIDIQGASTVRTIIPDAVMIFLTVEDEQEMIRRLTDRKTESKDSLKLRIAVARKELNRISEFDYVIVNEQGKLHETANRIIEIINAEHQRVHPRIVKL